MLSILLLLSMVFVFYHLLSFVFVHHLTLLFALFFAGNKIGTITSWWVIVKNISTPTQLFCLFADVNRQTKKVAQG